MVRFFNYIHMPPAELIRAVSYLLSLDRQFRRALFYVPARRTGALPGRFPPPS